MTKRPLAAYKPRPAVAARKPNEMIGPDGLTINSGKPHEELLASMGTVIPLQEQVDSLMRLGRIHRTNVLRYYQELSDDDFGDYIDEEDDIGLTPYEHDALKASQPPRHETPPAKPEPIEPSAPQNAGEAK